jgi:hypothetical protein
MKKAAAELPHSKGRKITRKVLYQIVRKKQGKFWEGGSGQ